MMLVAAVVVLGAVGFVLRAESDEPAQLNLSRTGSARKLTDDRRILILMAIGCAIGGFGALAASAADHRDSLLAIYFISIHQAIGSALSRLSPHRRPLLQLTSSDTSLTSASA